MLSKVKGMAAKLPLVGGAFAGSPFKGASKYPTGFPLQLVVLTYRAWTQAKGQVLNRKLKKTNK